MYYQFLPHSFAGEATDGGDFVCYPQAPRQTHCSFLLYSTFVLNQGWKVFCKVPLFIFQPIPSKYSQYYYLDNKQPVLLLLCAVLFSPPLWLCAVPTPLFPTEVCKALLLWLHEGLLYVHNPKMNGCWPLRDLIELFWVHNSVEITVCNLTPYIINPIVQKARVSCLNPLLITF